MAKMMMLQQSQPSFSLLTSSLSDCNDFNDFNGAKLHLQVDFSGESFCCGGGEVSMEQHEIWWQGETIGKNTKGLVEPRQAVGRFHVHESKVYHEADGQTASKDGNL